MTADQYGKCTIREYRLRYDALERRQSEKIALNLEAWRRARLIAYCATKPHMLEKDKNMTVYDFMPLEGDPTKLQQIEAIKNYHVKEEQEIRDVLEAYKKAKLKV